LRVRIEAITLAPLSINPRRQRRTSRFIDAGQQSTSIGVYLPAAAALAVDRSASVTASLDE